MKENLTKQRRIGRRLRLAIEACNVIPIISLRHKTVLAHVVSVSQWIELSRGFSLFLKTPSNLTGLI